MPHPWEIPLSDNERYWREKLKNQPVIKNAPPRSTWERFVESIDEFIRHDSPAAAVARRVTPYVPTIERDYGDDRPLEQRQTEAKKRITRQEREHREVRANYDPADSVGDFVSDFAGTMIGSIISDPSTLVGGFGKNIGEKLVNMAGMNALADLGIQGAEIEEGVRDEYDPAQGAVNLAIPVVVGGAGHAVGRLNAGRKIRAGSKDPEFSQLLDTIVSLEGGGTLAKPKTSPKGALGPMQVMPETARDPGFGIRPWNGKTQEDLARVGRQYAAVLNARYKGDKAKVLAAYNAGPGRVDNLVDKYGAEWRSHLPDETKKYVRNGLNKLNVANDDNSLSLADLAKMGSDRGKFIDPALETYAKWDNAENDITEGIKRRLDERDQADFEEQAMQDRFGDDDWLEGPGEFDHLDLNDEFFANEVNRRMQDPNYRLADVEKQRIKEMIEANPANIYHFPDITFGGPDGMTMRFDAEVGDFVPSAAIHRIEGEGPGPQSYTDEQFNELEKSGKLKDLDHFRNEKLLDEAERTDTEYQKQLDDNYWMARHLLDASNEGRLNQGHINAIQQQLNELRIAMRGEEGDNLDILQQTHDILESALAHSGVRPNTPRPDAAARHIEQKGAARWEAVDENGNVVGAYRTRKIAEELNEGSGRTIRPIKSDIPNAANDPIAPPKRGLRQLAKDLWDDESGELRGDDEGPAEGPDWENSPAAPAIRKLREALYIAKPLVDKNKRELGKARSAQAYRGEAARKGGDGGEAAFYQEMAAMRGEFPKADFTSIRDQFTQEDLDSLFRMVADHPTMDYFTKVNARKGLAKILSKESGEVPIPSELEALEKFFPKDVIDSIVKNKTFGDRLRYHVANSLNLPRAVMSSMDYSAPLRQGVFLVGSKEWFKAWGPMVQSAWSEKYFQDMMNEIKSRPTYKMMKETNLSLTDLGRDLSQREEAFMTNLAERIPLLGRPIRASNRAWSGFLNKLRADTFDSLIKDYREAGIDFEENPKALKDITKFINNATGRGDLEFFGHNFEQAAPLLSAGLFSPRLLMSRVRMLYPMFYVRLDPIVRKRAIISLIRFGSIATTVMGLAAMNGAEVEINPDKPSSDFLKIKKGNTRFDILGGFAQYLALGAKILSNGYTNSRGEKKQYGDGYGAKTRASAVGDFITYKEAPIVSFIHDYFRGEDFYHPKNAIGREETIPESIYSRFIPMFMQDLKEALKEEGVKGLITGVPAFFGVGVQTYKPQPSKSKKAAGNPWEVSVEDSSDSSSTNPWEKPL